MDSEKQKGCIDLKNLEQKPKALVDTLSNKEQVGSTHLTYNIQPKRTTNQDLREMLFSDSESDSETDSSTSEY